MPLALQIKCDILRLNKENGMNIEILKGKTLTKCYVTKSKEEMFFECDDGSIYELYHIGDCCEHVDIEDVCGDLSDLIGSPLVMVEEVCHGNNITPECCEHKEHEESYTWTFYKFGTIKGYVTVRWYGESNGYYSESVDFDQVI